MLVHAVLTPFAEVDKDEAVYHLSEELKLEEEASLVVWEGLVAVFQQLYASHPSWIKELTDEEWERVRAWVRVQLANQAQTEKAQTTCLAFIWDSVALLFLALVRRLYQARTDAWQGAPKRSSQAMVEFTIEQQMLPLAERDPGVVLPSVQVVLTFWQNPKPIERSFKIPGICLPPPEERRPRKARKSRRRTEATRTHRAQEPRQDRSSGTATRLA